jgi:NAD(P)-dependent dehydrogenase (short-subunit alcohol dehydrogenase family)
VGALEGTVALVTGASSGIGAATARRLAGEGAAVALVARRRERLEELASMIGGDTLVVQADVSEQGHAIAAVERTVAELGRLDTLVNNAGVMLLGPALESPTEEWDRMVALNVRGTLGVTHAALPHLARAAAGPPSSSPTSARTCARRPRARSARSSRSSLATSRTPWPTSLRARAGLRSTSFSFAPESRPGKTPSHMSRSDCGLGPAAPAQL